MMPFLQKAAVHRFFYCEDFGEDLKYNQQYIKSLTV